MRTKERMKIIGRRIRLFGDSLRRDDLANRLEYLIRHEEKVKTQEEKEQAKKAIDSLIKIVLD